MAYDIPPGFITGFDNAERASLSAEYKEFITIKKSSLIPTIKKWDYKSRIEQTGLLASILSQIYQGNITTFRSLPVFTMPNEMIEGSLARADILERVIKSLQTYGDAPPSPNAINSKYLNLQVISFYNRASSSSSYGGRTITGSNGVKFKVGDVITLNNFAISPLIRDWRQINGSYIIKGITTDLGLYVDALQPGTIQWSVGGATSTNILELSFLGSASPTVNSKNGVELGTPYNTWTGTAELRNSVDLLSSSINTPNIIIVPSIPDDPIIRLNDPIDYKDPYITPVQTTPTTPIAVADSATPAVPTVKTAGTTVTVPFLTSASFKPGTNAAANAKGKIAFIDLVKKASVSSKLTKEQSDQLMATVIKAIDSALLIKKNSLTKLKPYVVVTKTPVKKITKRQ